MREMGDRIKYFWLGLNCTLRPDVGHQTTMMLDHERVTLLQLSPTDLNLVTTLLQPCIRDSKLF